MASNHLNFLAKVSEIYERKTSVGSSEASSAAMGGAADMKPAASQPPNNNHRQELNKVPSANELIAAAQHITGKPIAAAIKGARSRRRRHTIECGAPSNNTNTMSLLPTSNLRSSMTSLSDHNMMMMAAAPSNLRPTNKFDATIQSSSSSGYILVNGVPVQIPEGVEVRVPSHPAGSNTAPSQRVSMADESGSSLEQYTSRPPLRKRGYQELMTASNNSSSSSKHSYTNNTGVNSNDNQASSSSLTSTPHQDLSHPSPHTQKCNTLFQRLGQSGLSEMATTTSLQLLLQHRRHNAVQRELARQKEALGMGPNTPQTSNVTPQYPQLLSAMPFSNTLAGTTSSTTAMANNNPSSFSGFHRQQQLHSKMQGRSSLVNHKKQRRATIEGASSAITPLHSSLVPPSQDALQAFAQLLNKDRVGSSNNNTVSTQELALQAFARFDSAGSSNTVSTQESTLPLYCTTSSQPLVLFRPCDKRKLNKLYYYIGNHILEAVPYSTLYNSTIDESTWVARERNIQAYRKSVTQGLHFVCRYCRANNNAQVHIQSAVFSTKTVGGIYRRIPQFITKHIKSGACTSIPEDVRNKILDMKKTRAEVGNGEFEVCLRSNGYRDTLGDVEHCVELVEKEE